MVHLIRLRRHVSARRGEHDRARHQTITPLTGLQQEVVGEDRIHRHQIRFGANQGAVHPHFGHRAQAIIRGDGGGIALACPAESRLNIVQGDLLSGRRLPCKRLQRRRFCVCGIRLHAAHHAFCRLKVALGELDQATHLVSSSHHYPFTLQSRPSAGSLFHGLSPIPLCAKGAIGSAARMCAPWTRQVALTLSLLKEGSGAGVE